MGSCLACGLSIVGEGHTLKDSMYLGAALDALYVIIGARVIIKKWGSFGLVLHNGWWRFIFKALFFI